MSPLPSARADHLVIATPSPRPPAPKAEPAGEAPIEDAPAAAQETRPRAPRRRRGASPARARKPRSGADRGEKSPSTVIFTDGPLDVLQDLAQGRRRNRVPFLSRSHLINAIVLGIDVACDEIAALEDEEAITRWIQERLAR